MSVIKYTMLVLTLVCCSSAFAQQTEQTRRGERVEERREQLSQNRDNRQDNRNSRPADGTNRDLSLTVGDNNLTVGNNQNSSNQDGSMDQYIATCLLIGNQEEVALAKLAVERAENDNVKQFAKMLVDDHQKAIQKLQQHAKQGMGLDGATSANILSQSQNDQSASAQNSQYANAQNTQTNSAQSGQIASNDSPTARQYTANRVDLDRNASDGTMDKILKLNQQTAQECLSMTKSMMEEKQGAEFDKAFAGSQIGAHVGMLAKLKASQQHASGELASIIQESERTVQNHLEEAKQLCKELEGMQASNR